MQNPMYMQFISFLMDIIADIYFDNLKYKDSIDKSISLFISFRFHTVAFFGLASSANFHMDDLCLDLDIYKYIQTSSPVICLHRNVIPSFSYLG